MTSDEIGRHHILEDRLRKSMETIRENVLEMGTAVEHAVHDSLQALISRDRKLAYATILRDSHVDALEKKVDQLCLEFLVREQPAAGHLRFAYAAIKVNGSLERIGDYAESVSRQTLLLETDGELPLSSAFREIGQTSLEMLRDSVRSFVERDGALARSTMDLERRVDDIRSQIRMGLVRMHHEGSISSEVMIPLLICAARFERVADMSLEICQEVLFMCTGEDIKHPSGDMFKILFVSKGNSIRSQIAEGIAGSLGLPHFVFASAGVTPGPIDPRTVAFMNEKGIDITKQGSKHMEQVPGYESFQVIIFLSREAAEAAPALPAKAVSLLWQTPDPAQAEGGEEKIRAAYERAYQYLNTHIRDFTQAVLQNHV